MKKAFLTLVALAALASATVPAAEARGIGADIGWGLAGLGVGLGLGGALSNGYYGGYYNSYPGWGMDADDYYGGYGTYPVGIYNSYPGYTGFYGNYWY